MSGGFTAENILKPQLLTDLFFGGPEEGVQAPAVVQSKDLPLIQSEGNEAKQKSVVRSSGRRKTLITRDNQLGAGDVKKKSVLG